MHDVEQIKTMEEISLEQYDALKAEEQVLYCILKDSEGLKHLIHYGQFWKDERAIVNFNIKQDKETTYFKFDIADEKSLISTPTFLYKVKGSVFENNNYKNIVYTIRWAKDNYLYAIYIDKLIKVKENVILNEVSRIDIETNLCNRVLASLTIDAPNGQKEKIIIYPDSNIYKLYSKGQIDVETLCNLALFQANNEKTTKNEDLSSDKIIHLSRTFTKQWKK